MTNSGTDLQSLIKTLADIMPFLIPILLIQLALMVLH